MGNMVWYSLAIVVELAIAFGLALLLHAQIRARRFFRVVFLLPLMLSPVAVSWMIGKSMLEFRFGPVSQLARALGWEDPAFFASEVLAKVTMMVLDAWIFIPFMMIMLLAGLQALPGEVIEAARVDGASAWQTFRKIIFPLMLPVTHHRVHRPAHLQAQARGHRHQHHVGRSGRRDRHRDELHLPRVPRPLERGLRDAAGDVLPGGHRHRPDAA